MSPHAFAALILLFSICKSAFAFDLIAHRGASGYLPEHTLEATALAHAQLPAYIEQDVVLTKDDIPVVLHDIHLDTVTNVASVFPQRAREDGRYYVIDFTLAEIKTLRVHERTDTKGNPVFPGRYQGSYAHFSVATLAEHLELIKQLNRHTAQKVGVYPEIKSPKWHRKQGKDISTITLKMLSEFGYLTKHSNIILQCFDFDEIKRLRQQLGYQGKLIQLISSNNASLLNSADALNELSGIVDGVGPSFYQLLDTAALEKGTIKPQKWLPQAKGAGLFVHPYTLRADQLPSGMTLAQATALLAAGLKVDGVFTDHVPAVKNALLEL